MRCGAKRRWASPSYAPTVEGLTLHLRYGMTKSESDLISLSGPLANILVALPFLILARYGGFFGLVGLIGVTANVRLAAFNPLPFGKLDDPDNQ